MLLKFLFFLPLFFIANGKCLAQEQQGQEVTEQEIKETQETLTIEPKQDCVNLIEEINLMIIFSLLLMSLSTALS